MTDVDEIEEVRLAIAPFIRLAAIDQLLESLGDVKSAVAAEERALEKVRRTKREAQTELDGINAAIAASKGKNIELDAVAQRDRERLWAEAVAKRDECIAAGRAEAERIIAAAKARAAEVEDALRGAQSSLARARGGRA